MQCAHNADWQRAQHEMLYHIHITYNTCTLHTQYSKIPQKFCMHFVLFLFIPMENIMSNYIRRTKYNIRYDILYEIVYLKLKFYGVAVVVAVMETEWIHSVGAMEQRVKEQSCVSTHTHTHKILFNQMLLYLTGNANTIKVYISYVFIGCVVNVIWLSVFARSFC